MTIDYRINGARRRCASKRVSFEGTTQSEIMSRRNFRDVICWPAIRRNRSETIIRDVRVTRRVSRSASSGTRRAEYDEAGYSASVETILRRKNILIVTDFSNTRTIKKGNEYWLWNSVRRSVVHFSPIWRPCVIVFTQHTRITLWDLTIWPRVKTRSWQYRKLSRSRTKHKVSNPRFRDWQTRALSARLTTLPHELRELAS